ncbi:hypothetical protein [Salegentibacter sp.]|uniref:hypothetical protein n=1 Tax=Salegentibacter sp. TaxID=1903072 RepID=UPI002F9518ED
MYKIILRETKLYDNIDFELFISSHKEESEISESVLHFLEKNNWNIIFSPNEGWDWGCHSEFVNYYFKAGKALPDYFLFLHDDLKIIKNGFIDAFLKKSKKGYSVIGNSLPFSIIEDYSAEFPEETYILNRYGFSTASKKIKPVRGSAFFIDSRLVEQSLKKLPYQKKGAIELANRSLRMFASIIANDFPEFKTGYLSSEHLKSEFIIEEMRGIEQNGIFFLKRKFLGFRKKIKYFGEDTLIALKVLKRQKIVVKKGKIKINISSKTPLSGFLNYDVSHTKFSDIIDLDKELDYLLKHKKISEIRIAENTGIRKDSIIEELIANKEFFNGGFDLIIEGDFPIHLIKSSEVRIYKDYHLRFGQLIPSKRTLLKVGT